MRSYYAHALIGDRVDSGPRDHRRSDRIRRPVSCHASCTGKIVWEHSPTRRKETKMMRINRGENSPINCHFPPYYRTCTWRPTRVPTWPRGLPATWPCPARLVRGPPERFHVASVPRRNPSWSRALTSRFRASLNTKTMVKQNLENRTHKNKIE